MYYRRVGDVPSKRHTLHRVDGAVVMEELLGEEGFAGPSSLLYHRHSPSAIARIEPLEMADAPLVANLPVTPYHFRTSALPADRGDAVTGRIALVGNDDVRLAFVTATDTSPLYRDAVGDELAYVQSGAGALESVFGRLPVGAGDYVLVPAGVTHRWVVGDHALTLLVVESRSHIAVPRRYLTPTGQLAEGAPFSERDIRPPDAEVLLVEGHDVAVLVRTRAGWSRHVHRDHPFDVVGWDGCAYPWALSHPRLRADRRAHPPATTGAPDVRRRRVRRLLVRAAARTTSTPRRSRFRTTTRTSTPTRSCSTATATS